MTKGRELATCGEQNDAPPPKDVLVPTPRTCEYGALHGKRDFADVKDLELGDYRGLSRWVECNHKGPYKERQEGPSHRNKCIMEAEVRVTWSFALKMKGDQEPQSTWPL